MCISSAQTGLIKVEAHPSIPSVNPSPQQKVEDLHQTCEIPKCRNAEMHHHVKHQTLALSRFPRFLTSALPPVHADAMGAGGSVVEGQIVDEDSENVTRNH